MKRNSPKRPADDPAPPPDDSSLFGFTPGDDAWMAHLREAQRDHDLGSIGRYRLLEEISRGGQGIVYRARVEGDTTDVALKRLVAGAFSSPARLRRFEREVDAAGSLEHPSVVRVFGLEHVDDTPLIAMEWIDGVPVDRWVRKEGGPERTLDERLAMFLAVCDALQHAHQRGVLHRDLKPSNILVEASGTPHLLDFGLAKLLDDDDSLTHSEDFLGTPAYASPEQIAGGAAGLDVRSDLYSLGVILFELVSGDRPFTGAVGLRAGLEARETPPRLLERRSDVGRDLDAIVGKALEPRPEDRYQSVDALAADLTRYRAGEEVSARPPSSWQLLRRLVRSNPVVSALAAALIVLTASFAVVASRQARALESERDQALLARNAAVAAGAAADLARRDEADERARAEYEAERSRAITTFVTDVILQRARPLGLVQYPTVADVVRAASESVEGRFTDPQLELEVRDLLVELLRDLGMSTESITNLEAMIALKQGDPKARADVAVHYSDLASSLIRLGRHAEAEPYLFQALELMETLPAIDIKDYTNVLRGLNMVYLWTGRGKDALPLTEVAVRLTLEAYGPFDPFFVMGLHNLGTAYSAAGDEELAEHLTRLSYAPIREVLGPDSDYSARVLSSIARYDSKRGDSDIAIGRRRFLVGGLRYSLGLDHPNVARELVLLGRDLTFSGETEEGLYLAHQGLAIWEQTTPKDSYESQLMRNSVADALISAGRQSEAARVRQQGAGALGTPPDSVERELRERFRQNLALARNEQRDEAEPGWQALLADYADAYGSDHPWVTEVLHQICANLHQMERTDEALGLAEELVVRWETGRDMREVWPEGVFRDALIEVRDWAAKHGADELALRTHAVLIDRDLPTY